MTLASAFPGIDICIREQLRLVEEMEPGAREKAVLHTARGTLNDREFQDIQSRFLARQVTKLDPWPEELKRAFARMGRTSTPRCGAPEVSSASMAPCEGRSSK